AVCVREWCRTAERGPACVVRDSQHAVAFRLWLLRASSRRYTMTSTAPDHPTATIDPGTEVGLLALTVADLERSLTFYTAAIGLAVLERSDGAATLGVAGRPIL